MSVYVCDLMVISTLVAFLINAYYVLQPTGRIVTDCLVEDYICSKVVITTLGMFLNAGVETQTLRNTATGLVVAFSPSLFTTHWLHIHRVLVSITGYSSII